MTTNVVQQTIGTQNVPKTHLLFPFSITVIFGNSDSPPCTWLQVVSATLCNLGQEWPLVRLKWYIFSFAIIICAMKCKLLVFVVLKHSRSSP